MTTLPVDDLAVIVDLWMWESPTELIPTNEQIADVRAIIAARADAPLPAVADLIAECDKYLAQ